METKKKRIIIVKKKRHRHALSEITTEEIGKKEKKEKPVKVSVEKKQPSTQPISFSKKKEKKIEKEKPEEKIEKKEVYKKGVTFRKVAYKKSKKEAFEKKFKAEKKEKKEEEKPVQQRVFPKEITVTETITVGELARKMNIKASELIKKFMEMGEFVTINQSIDHETAALIADEYGIKVKLVSLYQETQIELKEEDRPEDYVERPPVVTIMGHVDHGKTLLLDRIRESNIVEQEAGRITQHIGAYKVKVNVRGKEEEITFIDTPGHEAFTTMRARGAQVTDIVILVIAADDGIMPQTVESINHAKDAKVPVIVAINKIDIPGTEKNIERIKQELTKYELLPEEWGGETLVIPISAKENKNIDKLLEAILLQAELLELKANPKLRARGVVLESRKDPARGPSATVLIQNGTLRVGEPFVAGVYGGKVRAMFDDWGNPVKEAPPSTPVLITGIDGLPSPGDPFQAVDSEKYARQISQKRQELKREELSRKSAKVSLDSVYEQMKKGKMKELKFILKADVEGSAEALKNSLEKLSNEEIEIKVIHSATGNVTETDVMFASAANALIIAFNVKVPKKVAELAECEKVSIRTYKIIYD
ncbi:translation initiation factor IF-2, partial [Methanosarcinales archaeon]